MRNYKIIIKYILIICIINISCGNNETNNNQIHQKDSGADNAKKTKLMSDLDTLIKDAEDTYKNKLQSIKEALEKEKKYTTKLRNDLENLKNKQKIFNQKSIELNKIGEKLISDTKNIDIDINEINTSEKEVDDLIESQSTSNITSNLNINKEKQNMNLPLIQTPSIDILNKKTFSIKEINYKNKLIAELKSKIAKIDFDTKSDSGNKIGYKTNEFNNLYEKYINDPELTKLRNFKIENKLISKNNIKRLNDSSKAIINNIINKEYTSLDLNNKKVISIGSQNTYSDLLKILQQKSFDSDLILSEQNKNIQKFSNFGAYIYYPITQILQLLTIDKERDDNKDKKTPNDIISEIKNYNPLKSYNDSIWT